MHNDRLVHIIDDDPVVLDSLSFLMSVHAIPCCAHLSADRFLEHLTPQTRGCILSDVRMPKMDGVELLQQIRRRGSLLPFIVMTGHGDIPLAVRVMKEGAIEFLEKPFEDDMLLSILEKAFELEVQNYQKRVKAQAARDHLSRLTPREYEVLELISTGMASKVIAHQLSLSVRTVDVYRANILSKLNADNALSAVAFLNDAKLFSHQTPL
ncbi:hypothetical protein NS365_20000 [Aureimonas ureilytica]|uniref:LuxR family transcriptional regulator n=1 Tax=Aureimonas ureilytica TaxID=401562 RepID=A0A175RGU1_9HYPH|nr:response regulator [Aureimonas ureilytica]KTR02990.1 hypothetical protein NS365_20000 [Aureimonas ureilytica]